MIYHYLFEDVNTKVIGGVCAKESHMILITLQIALVKNFVTTFIFHPFDNIFFCNKTSIIYVKISFLERKTARIDYG